MASSVAPLYDATVSVLPVEMGWFIAPLVWECSRIRVPLPAPQLHPSLA